MKSFTNIIPAERSLVIVKKKLRDPHWLAGFASAEGCFFIGIQKSPTVQVGWVVKLIFSITQHSCDEQLIISLIQCFNCGYVVKKKAMLLILELQSLMI